MTDDIDIELPPKDPGTLDEDPLAAARGVIYALGLMGGFYGLALLLYLLLG